MTISPNSQKARTLQEAVTTATPAEIIAEAKRFFGKRSGIYSAFIEKEGPGWASFRGQGGEEIAIGTAATDGGTRVTASTYFFDQQVARFLSLLPAPPAMVESGVESVAGVSA
jgi:hypothetical protein